MKLRSIVKIFLLLLTAGGCVTKFIPEISENKNLLVVEGVITDQPEPYLVKLSLSSSISESLKQTAITGAQVSVSDDQGNLFFFLETTPGIYQSNPGEFVGIPGRKYRVHINTNSELTNYNSYESQPAELLSVPPIDSLYYEKVVIKEKDEFTGQRVEGCQVFLNSFDQTGKCRYYRWDFDETWEFRLPFPVENNTCWVSMPSDAIVLKSTAAYSESRITKFPLNFIDNSSDRLTVRYSALVNQYSVSRDEFFYWEKLRNITQNIGGLYDMIPSSVQGNVTCIDDPVEPVLGYFSVSGKSSKRVFVKDLFSGQINQYWYCITDTAFGNEPIPGLNSYVWILEDHSSYPPIYKVLTNYRGCADCTVRGTKIKPDFW
jgi:hypothetical protein